MNIYFTGYVVLKLLNIKINKYLSCEIDEGAKGISRAHNEDKLIEYIGDAKLLTKSFVQEHCPIDLLLGSPPCNDLSKVNADRKHFGEKINKIF